MLMQVSSSFIEEIQFKFLQEELPVGEVEIHSPVDKKNKEITLWSLKIYEPYRGKGLGHKLMQDILDYARKQEVERINLFVHKDNRVAIHLYERYGFAIVPRPGDQHSYSWKMSLKLNEFKGSPDIPEEAISRVTSGLCG